MSQRSLPPPNTARLAITSFCNVLRYYGILSLEPELVRLAKFDGLAAGPLWRVLHDVVLIVLAGCPAGAACKAALSRQWRQVSLELSGDDEFPHEGATLVLRQLEVWGSPRGLLRELQPPGRDAAGGGGGGPPPGRGPDPVSSSSEPPNLDHPLDPDCGFAAANVAVAWPRSCRSRPLLLALGWLAAAAGLFERRIQDLEPGPGLWPLLPPYPQDACVSPAVQAAYDAAARDAQEHVQKLPAGDATAAAVAAPAAAAGRAAGRRGRGSGTAAATDPFGSSVAVPVAVWEEVETAAQRAVMLCGRVRNRLVALQAATDCRNRLVHSLWSRQTASAPSTRPLNPYELQLCAQPETMQRHVAALETATLALLEQQELAAHGALFFEWLGSVIEEEEQYQRQRRMRRQGQGQGPAGGRRGGAGGHKAGRTPSAGALPSLEHLPYFGSDAGARLTAHLEAQLDAAVQAADPELAATRRRADDLLTHPSRGGAAAAMVATTAAVTAAAGGPGLRLQQQQHRPPPSLSVTVEHFLALGEQAVSEQQLQDANAWYADGAHSCARGGGGGSGVPGAASLPPLLLGGGGGGPAATTETDTGAWRLPDDLAAALHAVQVAEHRRRCTEDEEAAQFQQLRYAALARYDFSGGGGGVGPAAAPPPALLGPPGACIVESRCGPVSATAETQRLLGVVLAAARPLARTRAAHKAALLAALGDLPEGYFVAGL